MSKKKKIGISFSGGGNRAVAHIGIIKALRENGIEADYVAGTSGGAIVGAMYAAGLSVDEMMGFAAQGKLSKLFQAKFPTRGLAGLDFLGTLLDQYINPDTFEALNIPLTVVASNLNTGKATFLNSGPLYPAVMASCAIPLMFKPIEIENELYVDGGIFDNMPVSPLQENCDIIIGSNVIPIVPMENDKLSSVFSISMRSFDMIVAHSAQVNFPLCDIVIEPTKTHNYGIFNFSATKELFDIGYEEATSKIAQLKNLILV
ncbi:MAG: NTE family protein [Gammaproteobacteria bacterium]|jgi:NTE family protein